MSDVLLTPSKTSHSYLMVPVKPVKADLLTQLKDTIYVPIATTQTYGSVKIGDGLNVDNGVISFDKSEVTILSISLNGEILSIDNDKNVNIALSKNDVGLDQVDNTSDKDKPISNTQQEALNRKLDKQQSLSEVGKFLYVSENGDIDYKNVDTIEVKLNDETIDAAAGIFNFSSNFTITSIEGGQVNIDLSEEFKESVGKIDSISLNGVPQTIDENKNVNLVIPIDDKLDKSNADRDVLTNQTISINGDNVSLVNSYINLNSLVTKTQSNIFSLADDNQAGLMSVSDYKSIRDLQARVGQLEQKATRLLYDEKLYPTAEEINTFVTSLGYTAPFEGIAVVVSGTNHIWHYYEGDVGWKDDGVDVVSQFTNDVAGIIKGAAIDGKVYAETDGTGSVYGWDALNTKITNITSNYLKSVSYDSYTVGESVYYGPVMVRQDDSEFGMLLNNDDFNITRAGSLPNNYNLYRLKDVVRTTDISQTILGNKNFTGILQYNNAEVLTEGSNLSGLVNDMNYVSDANYIHTDNNYTTEEKTKLAGIDTSSYVPKSVTTEGDNVTSTIDNNDYSVGISLNVDGADFYGGVTIGYLGTNIISFGVESSASRAGFNTDNSKTVFSKPLYNLRNSNWVGTINVPSVTDDDMVVIKSDLDDYTPTLNLATVALSNSYNDLDDKPVIPEGAQLYSSTGQNTDGAMTQKATTDALPQAVTVTLTESQNFNDISVTNEQFDLLLVNPENYLIIETTILGSINVDLKYHRSQYASMSMGGVFQEMLVFECVNLTSNTFYTQRIDNLTITRQTQNGESTITVIDDILDFTTFVPETRTINGKTLANDITLTATDVNALPDSTLVSTININGQPQSVVNFDSEPQTQIDNKFDKTGGNITGNVNLQSNSDISLQFIDTSGTVDSRIRNVSASQALVFNSNAYYFRARTNAASGLRIHPTYMRPETDYDIGAISNPFTNGYFDNLILGGNDLQETLNNKTTVNINNVPQSTINFDSDPQTQIDSKVSESSLSNIAFSGSYNDLSNVPTASETKQGIIQIASDSEYNSGSDVNKAITPYQLASINTEQVIGDTGETSASLSFNTPFNIFKFLRIETIDADNRTRSSYFISTKRILNDIISKGEFVLCVEAYDDTSCIVHIRAATSWQVTNWWYANRVRVNGVGYITS